MKITIEPTQKDNDRRDHPHCTVSVQHPYDDLSLENTLLLLEQLLRGYGFVIDNLEHVHEYDNWNQSENQDEC